MANEVKLSFVPGKTVYIMILNTVGQFYNTGTTAFETYVTANLSLYAISMSPQGSASSFYEASFPTAIPSGTYDIAAKQQLGGSPAETDPTVGTEDAFGWTGTVRVGPSDFSTSGQVGQFAPIRLARGTMILNFPLYLKSSIDHVTPLVSGVVSGQISRDGGIFSALQSGAFTEVGLGFYKTTLTSGDLLANTAALLFTATGISGGTSDPLPIGLVLQRTSGQ